MQPGSSWDPNLNVFGQVWENVEPLPGYVQSDWVSKAPLKEAASFFLPLLLSPAFRPHPTPPSIPAWVT